MTDQTTFNRTPDMTTTYTPNPRAVIAKVDGDTQVMAQAHQQRRANEISALGGGFPYVLTYRLERPDLDIAEDCAFCYRTMEAMIDALKSAMSKDGTYHFAIALSGGAFNISDVLQPVAPVVEAAPVCGTCGGEGNCPDCMVWDMPLTETLADMFKWGETGMDAYAAVETAVLAAYPAPVVETTPEVTAQGDDIVTRLETRATESAQERQRSIGELSMSDIIDNLRDASKFAKSTGKHSLSAFGMADLLDEAAQRITDLEAQLDALRNPPYTLMDDLTQRGNELARDLEYAQFPQAAETVRNLVDGRDAAQHRNQQALASITAYLAPTLKRPLSNYERTLRDQLERVARILKGG